MTPLDVLGWAVAVSVAIFLLSVSVAVLYSVAAWIGRGGRRGR